MRLVQERGNYVLSLKDDYGKVINEQVGIYSKSGFGKGLAMEGILEGFHKAGYIVLCIADPKRECEFAFQMWEPKERYHLEHLMKIGRKPEAKKVKLYHPFAFSIPKNKLLPDINFFTLPLKKLDPRDWSLLLETESETETMSALVSASQNITNEDGLYGFIQHIEKSIQGKVSGKVKKRDPRNFYAKTGSGSMKSVSEVCRLLRPFENQYFLTKMNCPLNIDWKAILTDQEHYHVFLNNYLGNNKKILDFVVLSLLNGIINNKIYLKRPIVVALPEFSILVPFKPDGHKKQLSIGFKECLRLMRSSGVGMSSVSDSQTFSGVDKDVRDSNTTIFLGEMGFDSENVSKTLNYQRQIREQLAKMDYQNSFLIHKEEGEGGVTIFFSSSRHPEPNYVFENMYRDECPEKMKKYNDIIEMMDKESKSEINKYKEKAKREEKDERKEKEMKIKIKEEKRDGTSDDSKDIKIKELKDKNKLERMRACWEFRRDNPDMSIRGSALELGFPASSGNKTFKKYVDEFEIIRNNKIEERKEIDNSTDYEDNALDEL